MGSEGGGEINEVEVVYIREENLEIRERGQARSISGLLLTRQTSLTMLPQLGCVYCCIYSCRSYIVVVGCIILASFAWWV